MTKYTDDLKLSVIHHCLNGHGYKQTAKAFGMDCKQVELWVKLYQAHDIDGIRTRTSKTVYSSEFKHHAVLQILAGKSIRQLAIELNISNPALLSNWLKAYQNHGIMGLHPKSKGRKPMHTTNTNQAHFSSKPDDKKTQAELIAELQYLRMENDVLKKLEALERQQAKNNALQTK